MIITSRVAQSCCSLASTAESDSNLVHATMSATPTQINVHPIQQSPHKLTPTTTKFVFAYAPSSDGVDENLLILFHGFGDTHVPFARLGASLKLPQTATLAIRAPQLIPFLFPEDPEGFQWYPTYSDLGELLTKPDPTPVLQDLLELLDHLVNDCHWQASNIHLFGFAQGGSVAAELALRYWKHPGSGSRDSGDAANLRSRHVTLGSIVTISGPLLSYPTNIACPTPILIVHRPNSEDSALTNAAIAAFKKGFTGRVVEERLDGPPTREGMPSSRAEWEPIMRFWSDVLSRRIGGTAGDGVFRIG